jgi:hypothetical protein
MKKKYRLVAFTDGDARVYTSEYVTAKMIREWNKLKDRGETKDTARTVTQSDNKDALIEMAKMARYDYALELESRFGAAANHELVDRTARRGEMFP